MYKAKNSKLSEQNVNLMVSLANSKGSQDALGQQLSEAGQGDWRQLCWDHLTNSDINKPTSIYELPLNEKVDEHNDKEVTSNNNVESVI